MRRYFYDGQLQVGTGVSLQGDLFHHIFDVCRLQVGQHFELIIPQGRAYLVVVETVEKKRGQVRVQEERAIPQLREPHIHVYLSFPKVPTFELIVEKSVELGVSSITPFLSDFSHVRTRQQFPEMKIPRWQKIILQATQQSGRGDLMQIESVRTLSEILSEVPVMENSLNVIAYEGDTPTSLKKFLQTNHIEGLKRINLFVGSEGGFSEKEVETFKRLDLPPVTLGDQVLRVETACLTLVASLKYEFDLLESVK
jgi:16S rRNA (uracil1498-N3)-methyltransferase